MCSSVACKNHWFRGFNDHKSEPRNLIIWTLLLDMPFQEDIETLQSQYIESSWNRWRQGWLFWHASGSSAHLVQMKPIVYTNLSNNMNITNSHPYIDTVFACISRKSFGFNWNCRCWTYSVQISSVIPHCSDWLRTDFPWWTMIPKLLGNRTHYNHQPIVVLNHLQLILPRPATAYITHKGSGGTSFFSSPSPAPQGMIKLHRIDAPTMEIVTASYNKYIDINHKSLWINEC